MKAKDYVPSRDIPDLTGKVFLVTGGTAGLGEETLSQLAQRGARALYFTGRNQERANEVIAHIREKASSVKVYFTEIDFNSLESVNTAAKELATRIGKDEERLDGLLCNAGIMAIDPSVSKDGYEKQFAVNHLAHALLIDRLLPLLQATANARIVTLTSVAIRSALPGGIRYHNIKTKQDDRFFGVGARWIAYGQSKLANLLYARALAKRYPTITCVAVHPGVIMTGLFTGVSLMQSVLVKILATGQRLSVPDGAKNSLWALTAPTDEEKGPKSGGFYFPVAAPGEESNNTRGDAGPDALWEFTQGVIAEYH